ncbi:MAG: hypothetical protein LBQ97_06545 [Fusobacteriaceae bacterium]|jgi:sodium/proline symporter|nr:hypothetical protein [Fusobacteriaceae bacterium]
MLTIQIVMIVYIAICAGIGIYTSKYQTNAEEFYVAGKRLGPVVLGLAISSTIMSGMGFVGSIGGIYRDGYAPMTIMIFATVGTMISYLLLAEPLRRVSGKFGYITLADFAYNRFGKSEGTRLVVTLSTIIAVTGYIMTNLAALGTVVALVTGWSYFTSLTVGVIVVGVYVLLGGMLAAALTDAFQSILMMFLGVAFAVVAIYNSGGMTSMNEVLGRVKDLNTFIRPGTGYGWIYFIGTALMYGFGVGGQPHVVNKFYQINKKSQWKTSMFIATLSYFLVGASHIAGLGGRAGTILGKFPDTLANVNNMSSIFAMQYFPPIVAGILLSAIVAAMMSTCDSQVVTVTSALCRDFILRYIYKKKLSDKQEMLATRICIGAIILISYLLVFRPPTLIMWMGNGAWGIGASVLIPILVLGSRWKRGNRIAAIVAGWVGIAGSFGLVVLSSLKLIVLPVNAAVIGTICSTVVYIVMTFALPDEPNELVTILHDKSEVDSD